MRTQDLSVLLTTSICNRQWYLSYSTYCSDISRTSLSSNRKFIPFDHFHPISLSSTPLKPTNLLNLRNHTLLRLQCWSGRMLMLSYMFRWRPFSPWSSDFFSKPSHGSPSYLFFFIPSTVSLPGKLKITVKSVMQNLWGQCGSLWHSRTAQEKGPWVCHQRGSSLKPKDTIL